jgi:hypothetical protein
MNHSKSTVSNNSHIEPQKSSLFGKQQTPTTEKDAQIVKESPSFGKFKNGETKKDDGLFKEPSSKKVKENEKTPSLFGGATATDKP